jgi:hypothetical protein
LSRLRSWPRRRSSNTGALPTTRKAWRISSKSESRNSPGNNAQPARMILASLGWANAPRNSPHAVRRWL